MFNGLPINDPNLPAGCTMRDIDPMPDPTQKSAGGETQDEPEECGDPAEVQAAFEAYFRRCEQTLARRRREREGRKASAA